MKKLIGILCVVFLFQGAAAIAQDNPKKLTRKASRALSSFYMDQTRNADELTKAENLINKAVNLIDQLDNDDKTKTYVKRGEIYNTIAAGIAARAAIGKTKEAPKSNPAIVAYNSYMKAYEFAEKSYRQNDIYDGLKETASHLSAIGNLYIGAPDYEQAYHAFNAVLKIDKFLQSHDEGSVFQDKSNLNNQKFVVAVCALQIGKDKESKKLLNELYEISYDNPRVYSSLFNLIVKDNPEKAEKVLARGKNLFPEDISLLFAEINYLIKNKKFKELESKLKQAIKADPNNPSVRSALGNVYMNLFKKAKESGDTSNAHGYFTKAIDYYNQTLELDPKNFEAMYSIGMMYFNKGAAVTKEMQKLGLDEQKKYEALSKKSKELFKKALPYFKKAESINPNDTSTLTGLYEILARMHKLDQSKEIKARLEAVRGGKKFEKSYFAE